MDAEVGCLVSELQSYHALHILYLDGFDLSTWLQADEASPYGRSL